MAGLIFIPAAILALLDPGGERPFWYRAGTDRDRVLTIAFTLACPVWAQQTTS